MYATISQYIDSLNGGEAVETSNIDAPDALTIDADHIDRALASASNKINSALSLKYSIPIFPSPPDLVRICVRLARFELEIYEVRDVVLKQYEAAIVDLNNYRLGMAQLIGSDNKPVPLKQAEPLQTNAAHTGVGQRRTGNEWNIYPTYAPVYPARGMDYQKVVQNP